MIINHIGVSGGKDSTALLLWAVYESGYPKDSIIATFCDTGNEAQITYDHIAMLSAKVHPIETIKPPLDFFELARKKKRFPSAINRFCTKHLKICPTQNFIHQLVSLGYKVVTHSGVRADESADRALLPPSEYDPAFLCETFRPLLNWKIEDVWAIHDRYQVPVNQLYKMGAKRVGCLPCVMSRKSELAMIARKYPEVITRISDAENAMGVSFFHPDTVPAVWRTREYTTKKGKIVKIANARDVFKWAQTGRGGRQFRFDFILEADPDSAICPSGRGMCE